MDAGDNADPGVLEAAESTGIVSLYGDARIVNVELRHFLHD